MICNELRRIMDWANAAAVYLDKYRDSLVEHGADYDDPTVDAIAQLLRDAEDSDWISDYDTRHKEEL